MKNLYVFAAIFMVSAWLGSCKKSETPACNLSSPPSVVAPASEITAVDNYINANSLTATQHSSGLFYNITAGTASGNKPGQCSAVTINYRGMLTNGTVFDQTTTPATFYLYDLIAGWRIGLPLITAGQSIRLYIPPSLGYGSQQAGSVPPNSILIFDISLQSIQ